MLLSSTMAVYLKELWLQSKNSEWENGSRFKVRSFRPFFEYHEISTVFLHEYKHEYKHEYVSISNTLHKCVLSYTNMLCM